MNTDDRCNSGGPACITTNQVDSVALALLSSQGAQRTVHHSIPENSPNKESGTQPIQLFRQKSSQFNADQVNGNIDYNFSEKDRLAAKYYFRMIQLTFLLQSAACWVSRKPCKLGPTSLHFRLNLLGSTRFPALDQQRGPRRRCLPVAEW